MAQLANKFPSDGAESAGTSALVGGSLVSTPRPRGPAVTKRRGLFFFCPIPSLFISRGVLDGRRGTESQIFLVSSTSKPAELVIAPLCFLKTAEEPTGRRARGSRARAQGRRDPVRFVRAFHRHFSSMDGRVDGRRRRRRGALMYSRRLPPRMSVFCLAAVTEKRHISTRSVSPHTHFVSRALGVGAAMCSPGPGIFPALSLSAGKC